MADDIMKEVISVHDDQIFMEGYNLNEFANMNRMSASDFLDILQTYMVVNKIKLPGKINIQKSESMVFLSNGKIQSVNIGKVLASENIYNQVKEIIFDLAYTKCSNDILNASWESGLYVLGNESERYSCIYLSSGNTINQMISKIPIDRKEQSKKKLLLKIK